MLSIALTKGRLEKATVKLLKECGYGTEALENKGRSLVFQDSVKDIRYFLAKAADCITYVEHGVADAAVTGKDTLIENPGEYYELLDLKIGQCRFILGGLPGRNPLAKNGLVRIASKYPEVARKYFHNKGMDVEIIRIEGSVELAPLLGLCDGIIDIMVRAEDASKINRIVERFKLSSYDEATIRSEIQKTKEMKSKDKGVKTKTQQDRIKEEQVKEPIKKEEQSVNPHLAKTEKSPQSKPSSEMQRTSDQGTKMKEKPSVKEKLEKAKEEVKHRESLRDKSEVSKVAPKRKKENKEINR